MKNANLNLEFLFARFEWPSLMVRERSATQIVALLADPVLRDMTSEAFLTWLSSRKLESLAANLLVIPLRLKAAGSDALPSIDRIVAATRYPSVLSHLLLAELSDNWREPSQWHEWHSGTAPNSFTTPSYFERYKTGFVPPIYEERAKKIEKDFLVSFRRQWAYEWECIIERTSLPLSGPPHYFIRGYEKTHVYCDVPQSEAYRSAYLRALAWAVDRSSLPAKIAKLYALECCPIDIGVWKIQPLGRPRWWPQAEIPRDGLDTSPGQVWPQIEAIWNEQQKDISTQLLVQASGNIFANESAVCDLEIHGVFQRFEGESEPSLEEVVEWLGMRHTAIPLQMKVTLGGPVQSESLEPYVRQFGGWSLAPIAVRVESWSAPRWQAHRMYRGVWTAAPYLIESDNELVCDSEALQLKNGQRAIARWQTWHDNLQERVTTNIPPGVGECLWIDRDLIRDFCEATKTTFCWIVHLRFYHRRYSHEAFKIISDLRAFGQSNLFH